jgi:hypothetical protein
MERRRGIIRDNKGKHGGITEEKGDGNVGNYKNGIACLHCLHSCTVQKLICKALDLSLGQETG